MQNVDKYWDKIESISIMRVMAMFMIILFHGFYFYADNLWYFGGITIPIWDKADTFLDIIDLPMFVFISGFLFGHLFCFKGKYRDKKRFLYGKAKRLLLPYFIWGLLPIVITPSLFTWQGLLTGSGHLWFLLMLFGVFVIIAPLTSFLLLSNSNMWAPIFIIISSVGLLFAFHALSTHHFFLCSHAILYYMPFFIIGMYFAKYQLWKKIGNKQALITILTSLALLGYYVISWKISSFYIDYIIRLFFGTIIVATTLVLLTQIKVTNKIKQIISHFDRLSMGIYIIHVYILQAVLLINGSKEFFNTHYNTGPFILFAVSFLGGWGISFLFAKNKYLKWTIG